MSSANRRRSPSRLGLVVVAALVISACGSADTDATAPAIGESAPSQAPTTTPPTSEASDTDEAEAGEPDEPGQDDTSAVELHPDVLDATATQTADGTWEFSATLSSPYDSPERYADAWRVVGPDGSELGIRVLTHDHASEQPFTRSLSGVVIGDDVDQVTIEGRDQVSGWGGQTVVIRLER